MEKLYVESMVSKQTLIGGDMKRKIEKSLAFGKNIRKFVGMEKLLEEARGHLGRKFHVEETSPGDGSMKADEPWEAAESGIDVSVALPDGVIVYSTKASFKKTSLPGPVLDLPAFSKTLKNGKKTPGHVKHGGVYFIALPLKAPFKKAPAGAAIITFDEKPVKKRVENLTRQSLRLMALILAGGAVLLALFLPMAVARRRESEKMSKFKISLAMFSVIALCQIVFTGLSALSFKNYSVRIAREKTAALTAMLQKDIHYLLSKGLRIERLAKMEVRLGEIIAAAPELERVAIHDAAGRPLYAASPGGVVHFSSHPDGPGEAPETADREPAEAEYILTRRLLKGGKTQAFSPGEAGVIRAVISQKALLDQIKKIALDSATVLVISILFSVEMLILIFMLMEKKTGGRKKKARAGPKAIRSAAFIFLFGSSLSISFVPLHMGKLYEPIFGVSKDMAMGLPISMEMFFAGISIMISGAWLDRRGWHEPFFAGLAAAALGSLYSWAAPDALHFILSRGAVGFGYGLAWMASQGFVISRAGEKNKNRGIAELVAGIFAGSICGGAAGAMLAERMGYNAVFLISAAILLFVIAYVCLFMRGAIEKPAPGTRKKTDAPRGLFIRFMLNRNVICLILLSAFPGAVAVVGLLNYFCPIYLNGIGASQSDIGRFFMIYGICMIYLAPFLSRRMDRAMNDKRYMVISGLLAGLGFMAFHLFKF